MQGFVKKNKEVFRYEYSLGADLIELFTYPAVSGSYQKVAVAGNYLLRLLPLGDKIEAYRIENDYSLTLIDSQNVDPDGYSTPGAGVIDGVPFFVFSAGNYMAYAYIENDILSATVTNIGVHYVNRAMQNPGYPNIFLFGEHANGGKLFVLSCSKTGGVSIVSQPSNTYYYTTPLFWATADCVYLGDPSGTDGSLYKVTFNTADWSITGSSSASSRRAMKVDDYIFANDGTKFLYMGKASDLPATISTVGSGIPLSQRGLVSEAVNGHVLVPTSTTEYVLIKAFGEPLVDIPNLILIKRFAPGSTLDTRAVPAVYKNVFYVTDYQALHVYLLTQKHVEEFTAIVEYQYRADKELIRALGNKRRIYIPVDIEL